VRRSGAAALALLALLLGGCGGSQSSPRTALARYVAQVNVVEKQLAAPLVTVTRTLVQFARQSRRPRGAIGLAPVGDAQALRVTNGQINRLRGRLAALPAPAGAQRLRTLLLELVDRQAALTRQMVKLVVFLPGFARAMAPFGPALVALEHVLSVTQARGPSAVATVYAQKATALRGFRVVAIAILRDLRGLDPPALSQPPYRAQVRALTSLADTAGRLATALGSGSATQARPLLVQFSRAAAGPSSVAAQKAQIAAIRAYDAQLTSLNRLAEAASRERLRLSKTVA
jgi:hypothetical protein